MFFMIKIIIINFPIHKQSSSVREKHKKVYIGIVNSNNGVV